MGGPLGVGAGAGHGTRGRGQSGAHCGAQLLGPQSWSPAVSALGIGPRLGEAGRKVKLESGPGSFVTERDGGGARVTFKLHPVGIQEGRARLGQ